MAEWWNNLNLLGNKNSDPYGLLQPGDRRRSAIMGLISLGSQIGRRGDWRLDPTPPPINAGQAMGVYQQGMDTSMKRGLMQRELKKQEALKGIFKDPAYQASIPGLPQIFKDVGKVDPTTALKMMGPALAAKYAAQYKYKSPKFLNVKVDGKPTVLYNTQTSSIASQLKSLADANRTVEPHNPPGTSIDLTQGGSFGKELNKRVAIQLMEYRTAAIDADKTVMINTEALKLLNSEDGTLVGSMADTLVTMGNLLERFDIVHEKGARVNTETYVALMGNQVAQVIKAFGAGTGLSDADREYAQGIAGGNINLNKKSLIKIIGMNNKISRFLVKRYNDYYEDLSDEYKTKIPFKMGVFPMPAFLDTSSAPAPNPVLPELKKLFGGGGAGQ